MGTIINNIVTCTKKFIVNNYSLLRFSLRQKYHYKEFKRRISILLRNERDYPTTIQFPITYHCNCNCIMCGMEKLKNHHDISSRQIGIILKDKLFSKVTAVSINGGEPFLRNDLVECVKEIVSSLPKIKRLFIISNGTMTDRILYFMSEIKEICSEKGIEVHLSISVDAVGKLDDQHRGYKGAFETASATLRELHLNKDKYANTIGIICTLTKQNIYNVNEIDIWAEKNGYQISYNIASLNRRIDNFDRYQDFSLLTNEKAKMMAKEFFYWKYDTTKEERYYFLFLFLETGKRYGGCPCQYNRWITLYPDGNIGFCATQSKVLGNALECSAKRIVDANKDYLHQLISENCRTCGHYGDSLNIEGLRILHKTMLRDKLLRREEKW